MLLRESSGSSWEGMFNEAGDKIAESIGYVHHRRQHANLTLLQGKCPAQHGDIHVQPSCDTMSKKQKKKYIYIYTNFDILKYLHTYIILGTGVGTFNLKCHMHWKYVICASILGYEAMIMLAAICTISLKWDDQNHGTNKDIDVSWILK